MSFESNGANFKPYIPKISHTEFHSDGGGGNTGYSQIEQPVVNQNFDTFEHASEEKIEIDEKTLIEKIFEFFAKIIAKIIMFFKK